MRLLRFHSNTVPDRLSCIFLMCVLRVYFTAGFLLLSASHSAHTTVYCMFYILPLSNLNPFTSSLRTSTMIYFFGCCFFFCVFFCFCPPPRPGNVRYLSFSCGAVCARSKVVTARIRVQLVPWLWTARISAFTSCEFHCSPPPAASPLSFCRCLAFRTRRRHQKCTRQQKARAAGRRTERR